MSTNNIHPKLISKIITHNNILEELVALYNNKKLHHAYIFQGIKGIGKASLAYLFTKLILSSTNSITSTSLSNINSNAINLILNNSHPNLLTIEPEWDEKNQQYKSNITIEQTREIKSFLNSSSLTSNIYPKIVIIDAIDDLNVNAANSILKILEEPANNRLFLLICNNIFKILPTIRSRCIVKNFSPLNTTAIQEIIELLNLEKIPEEVIENKDIINEGSMQQTLWFSNKNNLTVYNLAKKIIDTKDRTSLNQLADSVKNLSSYNFRYLIELLIPKEKTLEEIKTNSKYLSIKLLLEQDKAFNLDKSSIITNFILELLI